MGALIPLLVTFYVGGTNVLMREFDPVRIWQAFQQERITAALAVPTMLQFMLQTYDATSHDVSGLRCIFSGGSPTTGSRTWHASERGTFVARKQSMVTPEQSNEATHLPLSH